MSVLVTGSNGFIGSAVVERLLARRVGGLRCLVRPASDRRRLLEVIGEAPGSPAQLVVGGLRSIDEAGDALDGADTVIHLAAGLRGSVAELMLDTVVTTRHLLEAARRRRRPPRIVLVSSFSVYGMAGHRAGAVVDETTPLEPHPEKRDAYAFAKLHQEKLAWSFAERYGIELVVLRPGMVHGPRGSALSTRLGLRIGPLFFFLGGSNLLPLSFVENCAEAIAVAAFHPGAAGQAYNVHDDDLPTARQYLRAYRRAVEPLRTVPVPYPMLLLGSRLVERYHVHSEGQLPAVLTPYKTASMYKPLCYDNGKLKSLGWQQRVPTGESLRRTFAAASRQAVS